MWNNFITGYDGTTTYWTSNYTRRRENPSRFSYLQIRITKKTRSAKFADKLLMKYGCNTDNQHKIVMSKSIDNFLTVKKNQASVTKKTLHLLRDCMTVYIQKNSTRARKYQDFDCSFHILSATFSFSSCLLPPENKSPMFL